MAQLNTNAIYLTVDGVAVASYFTDVKLEQSASPVDVTHGAAVNVQRNDGLHDGTISITLGYDIANVSSYMQHIRKGLTVAVDYGPEGNTAGKPRHTQSFLLTKVAGPDTDSKKSYVTFAISGDASDAPTVDMYAGGVF